MTTKGDLINRAYSLMKINGLTVTASAEDTDLALERLEDTMSENYGAALGYFFEETPDTSTPHNIDRKYWHSVAAVLASRLLPDFGKETNVSLNNVVSAAYSFLSAGTAVMLETTYPSRMPIGSGNTNRISSVQKFYTPEEQSFDPATIYMVEDDISDFTESYEEYLREGEDISSYTITSDTGLTVSGDSLSTPIISYTVEASGDSGAYYRVKIVAVTSDSRQVTRFITFYILSNEL